MTRQYKLAGLIGFISLLIISCSKNEAIKTEPKEEDTIVTIAKLAKTNYSGCFSNQNQAELKSTDLRDTIYYELNDDTLLMHVVVFRNCNSLPKDSVVINYSDVKVYVRDSKEPAAWCDCQFGFNYSFADFSGLRKVYLYYDEYYGTNEYVLWDSLAFK